MIVCGLSSLKLSSTLGHRPLVSAEVEQGELPLQPFAGLFLSFQGILPVVLSSPPSVRCPSAIIPPLDRVDPALVEPQIHLLLDTSASALMTDPRFSSLLRIWARTVHLDS